MLTLPALSLVQALDDDIPEVRRVYQLTLTSATPGADISPLARQAAVTMAASDLPHGLFSLPPGQLSVSEEEGEVRSSPRDRILKPPEKELEVEVFWRGLSLLLPPPSPPLPHPR